MKKVLVLITLLTIIFISCAKERVDEPVTKKKYTTHYWRIDGVEKNGSVYSSVIGTTRTETP